MRKLLGIFLVITTLNGCSKDPLTLTDTPLYSLPDVDSNSIVTIPSDTNVELSFQVMDWCRIIYKTESGYTPCSNLDLEQPIQGPLSGKTVIVDPGHGGKDNGAIVNDVREKDINRAVSNYLIDDLKKAGANVIETRKNDESLYLYDRPTITNLVILIKNYLLTTDNDEKESIGNLIESLEQILNDGVDTIPYIYRKTDDMNEDLKMIFELTNRIDDTVFVSIHSNVKGDSVVDLEGLDIILSGNSLDSLYPGYNLYNDEDRELFGNILGENISKEVPIDLRKVYFGDYAVLREENLPSALIELGYMDDEEDLRLLTNKDTQMKYAQGITNAIIEYFNQKEKVS